MASKIYPSDGFTRATVEGDLVVGNVVRMVNPDGSCPPFSDCVITRVTGIVVSLFRPMGWSNASMYGEGFSSYTSKMVSGHFKTVLQANGNPATMIAVDNKT